MIRVMVLAPWARRLGGAETMLATFIEGVDSERVALSLVFLEPGPWVDELAAQGRQAVGLPASRLRDIPSFSKAVGALSRLLRADSPDVLLNWSAKSQLYGAAAVALSRRATPAVWWQHMIPGGGWLDRTATVLPARAIGCSSRASERAQHRLAPVRPTFVVHPGVEPIAARPSEPHRRAHGRVPWVVGMVGNLQPWKGQDRLLRAQRILRNRGHEVHVLLVGGDPYGRSGAYVEHLRRLIRTQGLSDHVSFTGHVADTRQYFEDMDVFVSASTGEPFGIVLLEAMAHGLPVLAPDDGGPAEIIVSEQSGLLVKPATAETIAAALERMIDDDDLRNRLAAGGRERIETHFSANGMCRELERRLELLAAGR
jgi:glycosyltransferase involved in cell wall biosynthesis